jgi:hypothetical protein
MRTEIGRIRRHDHTMSTARQDDNRERTDLVESLTTQRSFLRHTVNGLSDEQAARRTTASELCLGGLIKHVALMEEGWVDFIERGSVAMGPPDETTMESHAVGFRMLDGETLAVLLDRYEQVARHTEKVVAGLPSLDASHPLPEAPWFEPGAHWTARQALLHILAETAQHCGHADILRESLDGAKTMG